MQTDTVVGIVGAVVLVSVMVGVFAYEYNSPGGSDDGGQAGADDTFQQAYPGLDPNGDLDNDGIRNADDDDLDGDNLANDDDTDVVVSATISGAVAQSAGGAQTDAQTFLLDSGATFLDLQVTYQRPAPLPGLVVAQPKLNFILTDSNGQTFSGQEIVGDAGDATVTLSWQIGAAPLSDGQWTLEARSNSPVAPAMSYTGELTVDYGSS